MRITVTKLCLMTVVLALCIFLSFTSVQPKQNDEQAQYDRAMERKNSALEQGVTYGDININYCRW